MKRLCEMDFKRDNAKTPELRRAYNSMNQLNTIKGQIKSAPPEMKAELIAGWEAITGQKWVE